MKLTLPDRKMHEIFLIQHKYIIYVKKTWFGLTMNVKKSRNITTVISILFYSNNSYLEFTIIWSFFFLYMNAYIHKYIHT